MAEIPAVEILIPPRDTILEAAVALEVIVHPVALAEQVLSQGHQVQAVAVVAVAVVYLVQICPAPDRVEEVVLVYMDRAQMAHITLHPGEIILLVLVVTVDLEETQAVLQDLLLPAILEMPPLLLVAQVEDLAEVAEGNLKHMARKKVVLEHRVQ
jgi:hypothetical protein